jgi:two-component system response regulator FixJ
MQNYRRKSSVNRRLSVFTFMLRERFASFPFQGIAMDRHLVFVIDDNAADRYILRELLHSVDLPVREFASVPEFLNAGPFDVPACIVADVRLPAISGLELLESLFREASHITTILVTGHPDVNLAVRAMKLRAEDFLIKPVQEQTFLDAIHRALKKSERAWQVRQQRLAAQRKLASLTDREREVLKLLVTGKAVKAIAAELHMSVKTLSIHRIHIQAKLDINNVIDMWRLMELVVEHES